MKAKKSELSVMEVFRGRWMKQMFASVLMICSIFLSDGTVMAGCGATPVPPGTWYSISVLCSRRAAPYCAMAPLTQACLNFKQTIPTRFCLFQDAFGNWYPEYYDYVPDYSPGSCAG